MPNRVRLALEDANSVIKLPPMPELKLPPITAKAEHLRPSFVIRDKQIENDLTENSLVSDNSKVYEFLGNKLDMLNKVAQPDSVNPIRSPVKYAVPQMRHQTIV